MKSGSLPVLLVEDETALRELMARLLERAGHLVRTAADASEACAAASEVGARFSAAIVDLTLPDSPGETVLNFLRQANGDLPLVAMSGMAMAGERFSLESGEPAYTLMKPFPPRLLVELLGRICPQPPDASAS